MLAKSYNAVGIQEVLAEVDVPKGSFYHYFASKEDFGIAVVEYYGGFLANLMHKRLTDGAFSPRKRLINYFLSVREYYMSKGCGQGCLVAKLATEISDVSPRIRVALKTEFDRWLELFEECVKEGQQIGEISPEHDSKMLAEFIYSSWEGALIRMQVNRNLNAIDSFMAYMFDYVIPENKHD